jgi:hypothetical protein
MAEPRRELTKQDWHALMLVYRLFVEVATHGHVALDNFLAAMREVPSDA